MTSPFWGNDEITVYHGDSLKVLRELPDASIDAVVTDPPYGLAEHSMTKVAKAITAWVSGDRTHVPDGRGFMGRKWDAFVPPPGVWDECMRVLKPGGHMLVFAGSRTVDLMTMSIRFGGFEIRDTITWLYGSGFPKSLDVAKAIDRQRDDRADALRVAAWLAAARDAAGWTNQRIDALFGFSGMAGHWTARPDMKVCHVPRWEQWRALKEALGFADEMDAEVWRLNGRKGTPGEAWGEREVVGVRTAGVGTGRGAVAYIGDSADRDVTTAATDDARRWQGWGTALKPASEPIVVARKPLASTVAGNVLAYGTGALNIDGCRVGTGEDKTPAPTSRGSSRPWFTTADPTNLGGDNFVGRWPSNVVLSHAATEDGGDACSDGSVPGCPVAELDQQSGVLTSGYMRPEVDRTTRQGDAYGQFSARTASATYGDTGGASRFFPTFRYEAKAPTSERPRGDDGAAHPTVKPLELMRWLVRLVTPPGGRVLDPFAGSGTTGEACLIENFACTLIERDESHLPLIVKRLSKPIQSTLDLWGS